MTIDSLLSLLDGAIPFAGAQTSDPVGLQVGDPRASVTGVMIAHDVDVATVDRAAKAGANCIVCYHPVIFTPLAQLVASDAASRVVIRAIQHHVAIIVVHTAFDSHPEGTNMLFARALGLTKITPLRRVVEHPRKIVTFVPETHVERVASAMWAAGGGTVGEYDECSFRVEGIGTFRGSAKTNPAVGKKGRRESVREVRLEMIVHEDRTNAVIDAMKRAHPYEEVAFDVIELENRLTRSGMGAVGNLPKGVPLGSFIRRVKTLSGAKTVRTNRPLGTIVRRIAIVGGSGGSYLRDALAEKADVLVTGDVRYHSFREASSAIALVDAGHAETEWCVVGGLGAIIRRIFRSAKVSHIRVVRASRNNLILHV